MRVDQRAGGERRVDDRAVADDDLDARVDVFEDEPALRPQHRAAVDVEQRHLVDRGRAGQVRRVRQGAGRGSSAGSRRRRRCCGPRAGRRAVRRHRRSPTGCVRSEAPSSKRGSAIVGIVTGASASGSSPTASRRRVDGDRGAAGDEPREPQPNRRLGARAGLRRRRRAASCRPASRRRPLRSVRRG